MFAYQSLALFPREFGASFVVVFQCVLLGFSLTDFSIQQTVISVHPSCSLSRTQRETVDTELRALGRLVNERNECSK